MHRLPNMEPEGRVPYHCGFAAICMSVCVAFTVLGYSLVGTLPVPLAAGIVCIISIYFTIAMAS